MQHNRLFVLFMQKYLAVVVGEVALRLRLVLLEEDDFFKEIHWRAYRTPSDATGDPMACVGYNNYLLGVQHEHTQHNPA